MTSVVLWPASKGWAEANLLGRPVWRRTLDAARGLGNGKPLWLASSAPDGALRALSPSELRALRGVTVVLPAEAPLVARSTLTRLAKLGDGEARALFGHRGAKRAGALVSTAAALRRAARRGLRSFDDLVDAMRPAPAFPGEAEELLRVDSPESFAAVAACLRRRKIAELLRRGVIVSHPESVLVDPEVRVGKGAVLHPWVHLEGETTVGPRAVVGSFSHVVDSIVGADTLLLDHCFVRSSRIGKGAQIGPFAHLRPESDVGRSAKVGNFVELKKTRLGEGAKAPHLAYVGDADIGKGANLGAGTITCNYDGERKHRTVVGDGAFIGSDVQLVAPVRVGKGAYVAAGSSIVEDVPAYALALARSRQIVKRGWARKKKSTRAARS